MEMLLFQHLCHLLPQAKINFTYLIKWREKIVVRFQASEAFPNNTQDR